MSDRHKEGMYSRSHDPLREASVASPAFTKSWLTNGELLTRVQRVGYAVLSFGYVGAGLFTLGPSIDGFKEGDVFMPLGFGVAAAFFLYFGLRGLRNVLRFRRKDA